VAGVDTLAKRYYPFLVSGALIAVAYFQASGISSLIAEQLKGSAPSKGGSPEDSLARLKRNKATRSKSGQEILARNAFDSTTGPLVGKPPPAATSAAPASRAVSHAEPPKCQSGEVKLIAGAIDPHYSFAVIANGAESHMRRVGDEVDGKKIESIIGETVVLAAGEDRCKLTMHDDQSPSGAGSPEPGPRASEPDEGPPRTAIVRGSMSGIRRVSETEFVIEDDGPQKVAQMQQAFGKSSKVVPGQGVRLYRSAQTTILGHLGMRKSDIIKSINGHDMSTDEASKQAIAQLEGANDFQVVLERNGSPVTVSIRVEK